MSLATKKAILIAVQRGLSPLRTQVPQTAVEWCDEHFFLPEGSSQISGRWHTQPVQKAPLNMMGNDAIQVITVQKPTRFGYTKMLCGALWYLGVHKKRSAVVYQPNDSLAKDFMVSEVNPLLPVVPAIQAVFPDWSLNNENNTVKKKVCTGFSIDVKGAESPNNFRAITKQVVIADELGAFSVNGGEGDNIKVLMKRIQGASFGKAIFGSTVVFTGDVIERLMTEADAILSFHLPCPHCGTRQTLEWGDKDSLHGMKWDHSQQGDEAKSQTAYYSCKTTNAMTQKPKAESITANYQEWKMRAGGFVKKQVCGPKTV